MTSTREHRLVGLEPDNLLAFLALLGTLRALEAVAGDDDFAPVPRAFYDLGTPPLRPSLRLDVAKKPEDLAVTVAAGVAKLTPAQTVGEADEVDLSFTRARARELLLDAQARCFADAGTAEPGSDPRQGADVLAALFSDAAIKPAKDEVIATPLCLLFGQGHQHFLDRFAAIPAVLPSPRGKGKSAVQPSIAEAIVAALFAPWTRSDDTFGLRLDTADDVRAAYMAGDPTDPLYKPRTEHGANLLAAIGFAALTTMPITRGGAVWLGMLGANRRDRATFVHWPIWRGPASLAALRAMLSDPEFLAETPGARFASRYAARYSAQRIPNGKFTNFARGVRTD